MSARLPVEVFFGDAPRARAGIEGDFAMLASAARSVRVWSCDEAAVVLGVSRNAAIEVDEEECRRRGAALLRRASGGGTVVIGPGTLQYAFLFPHDSDAPPPPLDAVKQQCNAVVIEALREAGCRAELRSDCSGDLCAGDYKVGGVAMRRQREATLLHGTLLLDADLDLIASLLRHPEREPAWRRGRGHRSFLANLGVLDEAVFGAALLERS